MPSAASRVASSALAPANGSFVERRRTLEPAGVERRQFSDSRTAQRPEIAELGAAVDRYKLLHRRRFITFEELYEVLSSLGYHK